MSKNEKALLNSQYIDLVYSIRGQRVMLDRDLAIVFETETRKINQQVKRNASRFGDGYEFKLNKAEFDELKKILKSQNVISSWGGVRYPPRAFTEKGIYMVATVLRSEVAHQVSKHIVETFTETKKLLDEKKNLKNRIAKLETEANKQNKVIKTLRLIARELNKHS